MKNENIKLDWDFKVSLLSDAVRVSTKNQFFAIICVWVCVVIIGADCRGVVFQMSTYIYRISGIFRDNLIFAIFAISFKSQKIEYAEIILCIIFFKKLF